MLLLCCRLPPSLPPIHCFEGFVSDSSFLMQLLSPFVTLFLPSLGSPSRLDLVCSSLLFLLCQAFALLSFLSPSLIVSHNTDKQVLFLSAFFCTVLWSCRFSLQDRHARCMSYSFQFREFRTHVRRSARVGDNRKQSKQPGELFIENSADLFAPCRSAPTASVRLCSSLQNIQNHRLSSENRTDSKAQCSYRSSPPIHSTLPFNP